MFAFKGCLKSGLSGAGEVPEEPQITNPSLSAVY